MDMEQYWPQHKVFLFGRIVLFAPELEGQKSDFSHYFPVYNTAGLVAKLREYEQDGYFKVETTLDTGYIDRLNAQLQMEARADVVSGVSLSYTELDENYGLSDTYTKVINKLSLTIAEVDKLLKARAVGNVYVKDYLRFKLTDVNKQKFHDELTAYLAKYQQGELTTGGDTDPESFENQIVKLRAAVAKDTEHGNKPIIKQTDIWQTLTGHETFWELILTCQLLTKEIEIANMGYNDTPARVLEAGISSVARAGTVPFAKIIVTADKFKQPAVLPDTPISTQPHVAPTSHSARIVMSDTGLIEIKLDDDTKYRVKKVRLEAAPYNFLRYLLDKPNTTIEITEIHDMIKGCKSKKDMTEVVRQCGFDETLKAGFFNGTTKDKVRLTQDIILSSPQLASLKNNDRKQS
jgi:hypothetical protein